MANCYIVVVITKAFRVIYFPGTCKELYAKGFIQREQLYSPCSLLKETNDTRWQPEENVRCKKWTQLFQKLVLNILNSLAKISKTMCSVCNTNIVSFTETNLVQLIFDIFSKYWSHNKTFYLSEGQKAND